MSWNAVALTFVLLLTIPVDFPYWLFALLIALNGVGSGLFSSPNAAAIMSCAPANQRGVASGMRGTFFNAGSALSIGVFFSLMIAGLATTLPGALSSGLQAQGVSADVAGQVAGQPPVGTLFSAFLGFNPISELLGPTGALQSPGVNAQVLTGQSFFPQLISGPFHSGLVVVFAAAAVMMVVGAVASALAGGRDVHAGVEDEPARELAAAKG